MRRRMALLVLLLLAGASAAQSAWPQARGDSQNTGASVGAYAMPENVYWRSDGHGFVAGGLVFAQDLAIFGNEAGQVTAVHAATGKTAWTYDAKDAVTATPTIVGSKVYGVSAKGAMFALDLSTGEALHSAKIGASQGAITAHEGKLYVGSEAGKLHAFTATLDLLWTFDTTEVQEKWTPGNATRETTCDGGAHPARPIRGAPAVYADKVYFASMNHYVYAVDERGNPDQTTDLSWTALTEDIVLAAPVVDAASNRLIVASYDEKVRAYNLATPGGSNPCFGARIAPQWSATMVVDSAASKVHASPAFADGMTYAVTNTGGVVALSTTGQQLWAADVRSELLADPVLASGMLVVGDLAGKVHWFDAKTGKLLQRMDAGGPVQGNIAPRGLDTYVITSDGVLSRLSVLPVPPPDLVVEAVTVDGSTVAFAVRNEGVGPSRADTVRVWLNDILSIEMALPPLAPDEEQTFEEPLTLGPGLHIVRVQASSHEPELTQENNQAEGSTFIPEPPAENVTLNATGNATAGLFGLPTPALIAGGVGILAVATGVAMLILRKRAGKGEEEEEDEDD